MADFALSTDSPYDYSTDPTIPGNAPAPPADVPDERAPPSGGRLFPSAPQQAINPTATPGVQQPQAPQRPTAPTLPFNDDEEYNKYQQDTKVKAQVPISYLTGEPTFEPKLSDRKTDARLRELDDIQAQAAKLPRSEATRLMAQVNAARTRITRELDQADAAERKRVDQQRSEHLKSVDIHFTEPKVRDERAATIQPYIERLYKQYSVEGAPDMTKIDPKTGMPGLPVDKNDPVAAWNRSYNLKATPLSTLGPVQLRDTVTSIALLNPRLSNDQAMAIAMAMGSPVEMRPEVIKQKTGSDNPHLPGYNRDANGGAVFGKGATNFRVLGIDPYRKHVMVEMSDGTRIRIDPQSFDRLEQARVMGYSTARQLLLQREQQRFDAKQPGPFERNVARPAIDFMNKNVIDPAMRGIGR